MFVKCRYCGYTYYQTEDENCPDCGESEFDSVAEEC